MYDALGIHVFAGGFSRGIQLHPDWNVLGQLEIHGLGGRTVTENLELPFHMSPRWEDWPTIECSMCYGNPRCTGFSCLTGGYSSNSHGPWSKQTQDVHDLVQYAMKVKPPIIVWESVQQAYTTGKPLLDYLRDEYFVPNGYKIAHLFINAATFNNAQNRKRYFMLAYQSDKNFNICPPKLPEYRTVTRHVIAEWEGRPTTRFNRNDLEYSVDAWLDFNNTYMSEWQHVIDRLPAGLNFNTFARYHYDELPPGMQAVWDGRTSEMPFSMHCPYKMQYDTRCPTLWGSCQLVHPNLNRLLTIRELAMLMGWDFLPLGANPIGQIAKGIVPSVGTWLAEQAKLYLDDAWGKDDFASEYDSGKTKFVEALHTPVEKVFNITEYATQRCKEYERWLRSIATV